MKFDAATAWLKKNVPVKFWDQVEDMWIDQNLKYRSQVEEMNTRLGLSQKTSLRKLLSYWGAIAIPKWAMRWSAPGYPGFADATNYVYASVFRLVWPGSRLCGCNDETLGDHVEALLGWHIYMVQVHDAVFPVVTRDVITCMEQAFSSEWCMGFFYP